MIDGWMGRVFMCKKQCWMNVTCAFWLKYHSSLRFFLLRWPRPWLLWIWRSCSRKLWSGPWKIQGRRSRISRPLCGVDPKGRKPLFAVLTAQANERGRAVGAQPCDSCGRWSSCWCEACEVAGLRPPTAICTSCDHAAIICERCREAGRTWEASQAAAPGTIQSEASSQPRGSGKQCTLRSRSPSRRSRASRARPSRPELQPGPRRPLTPPRMIRSLEVCLRAAGAGGSAVAPCWC